MANRSKSWHRLKPRVRHRREPGATPGTLTIDPDSQPTTIRVMAYDQQQVVDQKIEDPNELKPILEKFPVVWVDVAGLGSEDKLRALAEVF